MNRKYWHLQKVKGRMTELNFTQKELADYINLGVTSLNEKLNGISDLTRTEMINIMKYLDIKPEECYEYFFSKSENGTRHIKR